MEVGRWMGGVGWEIGVRVGEGIGWGGWVWG